MYKVLMWLGALVALMLAVLICFGSAYVRDGAIMWSLILAAVAVALATRPRSVKESEIRRPALRVDPLSPDKVLPFWER